MGYDMSQTIFFALKEISVWLKGKRIVSVNHVKANPACDRTCLSTSLRCLQAEEEKPSHLVINGSLHGLQELMS